MNFPFYSKLVFASWFIIICLLLNGCAEAPSTLAPKGPAAAQIASLWWKMLGLAGAILVLVTGVLLLGLFRSRPGPEAEAVDEKSDTRFIWVGGIAIPITVLIAVSVFGWREMDVLLVPDTSEALAIEIVGHQWWWEIRYPNQEIATANEIHIPVNERVLLRVTSTDVIHSFWVPELHGKIDMIPGITNRFWLQADEAGVYYGECAEFCGIQHAKMAFYVIAEPREQFDNWLQQQSQPAAVPASAEAQRGQQIFFEETNCAECHTIQGTGAAGTVGPDLTHLASRRSLAAGIVPNNPDNLAAWIVNPQGLKPGSLMPNTDLRREDIQALVAYLESLQ